MEDVAGLLSTVSSVLEGNLMLPARRRSRGGIRERPCQASRATSRPRKSDQIPQPTAEQRDGRREKSVFGTICEQDSVSVVDVYTFGETTTIRHPGFGTVLASN